ncbi:hypothetical protein BYT27DRAFT_6400119 [Phlegmacium glaucopus]|nr:hypothetical protein BYT27DRAFT_6400119 [Phlegmacium glaucopus]
MLADFVSNDSSSSCNVYAEELIAATPRAVAIAEVIVFSIMPKSLWFLAIDFSIGKFYANSFLATLNSRQSIRANASSINSSYITDIAFVGPTDSTTSSSRPVLRMDTRGVESMQLSNDSQSHLSTRDKKSAIAPYNV